VPSAAIIAGPRPRRMADPEDGRSRPAPVVVAGAQGPGLHLAHGGGEAEAEADAFVGGLREAADGELGQVLAARQVVHVHDLDGAGPEDPRAVQFAAPAQHLAEAQVVGCGAGEAAAAGFEAGVLPEVAIRRVIDQLQALVRFALIVGGEAVDLVGRHEE